MSQQQLQPGAIPDIADERWKVVREILASRSFAKAPRLSSFLAYICAETLKGNSSELNERQIGFDVFGRAAAYLPAEDSIVRASARLLRNRLEAYFATEGEKSEWVIIIPRGSYVPIFERRRRESESLPPLVPIDQRATNFEDVGSRGSPRFLMVLAALVSFAVVVSLGVRFHRHLGFASPSPDRQLWSILLTPKHRTLLVPADTTLSLIQTGQDIPLTVSEYLKQRPASMASLAASGSFPKTLTNNIDDHQYTSIADLEMAFRVARLPQAASAQLEVRYARDLTLSEAKTSNLILMGGPRANPWVQIFSDRLDYSLDDHPADGLDYVHVRSPRAGESARYMAAIKGEQTYSLGVIAFIGGLEEGNNVLMIEGTDMAGTEGACDFLLDSNASSTFLARFARPDGYIGHFEMLLQTKTVRGNASEHLVLAYRALQ